MALPERFLYVPLPAVVPLVPLIGRLGLEHLLARPAPAFLVVSLGVLTPDVAVEGVATGGGAVANYIVKSMDMRFD